MNFLLQPYPYDHKGKYLIINTLLILVVGFFFDYFLIPFERDFTEHLYSYWIITLAHIGVAAVVYFVIFFAISLAVNDDEWKVYKEALALLFLLLLVGTGQFLIRDLIYDNPENGDIKYLAEEIKNTLLSGAVIIAIVININYHRKRLANSKLASSVKITEESNVKLSNELLLKAGIVSDNFEINPSHIICIKSDGNYLEFFVKDNDGFKKHLKRMTLQSAIDQLRSELYIVKTHRAFLVNTQHLKNVEGNAQGYQLTLYHLDFKVPVSRTHLNSFNRLVG